MKLSRKEWIFTWRELKLRGRECIFTWREYTAIYIYMYVYMYIYLHTYIHTYIYIYQGWKRRRIYTRNVYIRVLYRENTIQYASCS